MGDGLEGLRQGQATHECAIIEQRGEVEPNPLWHRVLSVVMVGRELYSLSPLLCNVCLVFAVVARIEPDVDKARKRRLNVRRGQ
jgi:hypothetical protein